MTNGEKKAASWCVYIVCCSDGTLYTGITTDIERRMEEHNSEKGGARYTRSRRPVQLVYRETAKSRSGAARREYHRKLWPLIGSPAYPHTTEELEDFIERIFASGIRSSGSALPGLKLKPGEWKPGIQSLIIS